jgi:hypothetical protein
MTQLSVVLIGQGVVGIIVTIASAIIISRVGAVHKLVNSRSELQDGKIAQQGADIKLLTAQLVAQGLLLHAAETASKHSE